MKKLIIACLGSVLFIPILSTAVGADEDLTSQDGGSMMLVSGQPVRPPRASVGGGTWVYGFRYWGYAEADILYSFYKHDSKKHSASVKPGYYEKAIRVTASAGNWADAEAMENLNGGNEVFWNNNVK